MMSIRSLADFNGAPGRCGDWLAPPPSPPRAHAPGRHDERGMGTSTWPPAWTYTWPSAGTFPWPRTDVRCLGGPTNLGHSSPTSHRPGASLWDPRAAVGITPAG